MTSDIKIHCPHCGARIDQNEYDSNDPYGSWICENCGYGLPDGLGITNKEMFNMNAIRATTDNVGEWDGMEDLAAKKFNKIQDALYDAAPDHYDDDQLHALMSTAWDIWGSDENLLTITDEQIKEYVNRML